MSKKSKLQGGAPLDVEDISLKRLPVTIFSKKCDLSEISGCDCDALLELNICATCFKTYNIKQHRLDILKEIKQIVLEETATSPHASVQVTRQKIMTRLLEMEKKI